LCRALQAESILIERHSGKIHNCIEGPNINGKRLQLREILEAAGVYGSSSKVDDGDGPPICTGGFA